MCCVVLCVQLRRPLHLVLWQYFPRGESLYLYLSQLKMVRHILCTESELLYMYMYMYMLYIHVAHK